MKSMLFILVSTLVFSEISLACSEAGPHDFEVTQEAQKKCTAEAKEYAVQFGKMFLNIEGRKEKTNFPKKSLMYESAVIYKTKKQTGNSNLVGFNVAMKSKDGWECNFCVDMAIDATEVCYIDSITKNMCSK